MNFAFDLSNRLMATVFSLPDRSAPKKEYPLVCFRHKFISDALRQGTHALQIAWYTGTSVAMIQQTYGSITSPDLFKQVFSNAPEEALERAARTKWFDEQLKQNRERKEIK